MLDPALFEEYNAQWSPYFSRARFFYHALNFLRDAARTGESPWGAYWEFGVGVGSLRDFYRAWRQIAQRESLGPPTVVGFDTFTGLPAPTHPADARPDWTPGKFATSMDAVLRMAQDEGMPAPLLLAGRFEYTLIPYQNLTVPPPMLVTIDVDYYSSTCTVLDFLAARAPAGTLCYFDDIWAFAGDPSRGQLRAIRDFNQRPDVQFVEHRLGLGQRQVWALVRPLGDRTRPA